MIDLDSCSELSPYIQEETYENKDNLGTSWRSNMMEALVRFHYRNYSKSHYKNKASWDITTKELINFPKGSLGYELGSFLKSNNFNLIPKFENHDVFHVVLDYTPLVTDEIKMQFCLAGSGRRTLSTFATMIIGGIFYPEYIGSFIRAFIRGCKINNFSYQEFKPLLDQSLDDFKQEINC